MSSSLTNQFRTHMLKLFKADIDSDGVPYHIGIARPEPVDGEPNVGSRFNEANYRHTLESVKTLSNSSFVIPTITWEGGKVYEAYDNKDPFQSNFYVINSDREVFLCVQQAKLSDGSPTNSFIEPTAAAANNSAKTFQTEDGYLWRYLYKISNLAYGVFRTKTYTPVKKVTNTNTTIPEEIEQIKLQDSAVAGEIINIAVDSVGLNYTLPTITISGDGFGASFRAQIEDNKIVNVLCDSNGFGSLLHGQGYNYAQVTVTDPGGGTGAKLRAVLAPKGGVNHDPVETLKCREIMLQTDFIGNEEFTIIANGTEFYQVGLIKGLQKYGVDSDFTGNTGQAMKKLIVSSVDGVWLPDEIFANPLQTVKGKVFYLNNNILYYYQDDETGFEQFTIGESIVNERNGTAEIVAFEAPDVNAYTGELLYLNTLDDPITRESVQTEDIRIVVQLG